MSSYGDVGEDADDVDDDDESGGLVVLVVVVVVVVVAAEAAPPFAMVALFEAAAAAAATLWMDLGDMMVSGMNGDCERGKLRLAEEPLRHSRAAS
ncbi:hypothetical protein Scep_002814 [Stephania cephalantha]|uniref:Uncharacterized protein n=1 Tax=Stephania cephalantha TaxID=152367 RepID=A0AAP0LAP1_9MAGN